MAATAAAEDVAHYKSIVVRFTIAKDGSLHLSERDVIEVPPGVTKIERTYPMDGTQPVTWDRVALVDDGGAENWQKFASPWRGHVEWGVEKSDQLRTYDYIIDSTIGDAVIPAWSIPRGRISRDSSAALAAPKERLRSMLAIWREAAADPKRRYLLDFQYEMPPVSDEGTDIRLELYWPDQWDPVHAITGDTIATKIPPDFYNSTRWRVQHLFTYSGPGTPAAIDVRGHFMRAAAIAGYPLAALLLWLLFFLREAFRRRAGGSGVEMTETTLRETLLNEPPEVVAARWNGNVMKPRIEAFLRRLEQHHKVAITIEQPPEPADPDAPEPDDYDDEAKVSLRLLVPREQLTPYERMGIDALIPDGWETSTADIRKRAGDDGMFDATDSLESALTTIANQSGAKVKAPWYSKLTSFALFAAGMYLLFREIVEYQHEPILAFASLMAASALTSIWPDAAARAAIQSSLRWTIVLFIPLALTVALIVIVHAVLESPPGFYGSAGLVLVMLAVYKAILASSATRVPRDARQRYAELANVRAWMQRELRSEHPRLRDDLIPWIYALGLRSDLNRWRRRYPTQASRFGTSGWSGTEPKIDEYWGDSLVA